MSTNRHAEALPELRHRPSEEPPSRLGDDDLGLLLLIRQFEEGLLKLFAKNKVSGTTHTCIGQEYVPVSLRPLLEDNDYVLSNHRGHGHYLARYQDAYGLLCEITGKGDGICRGVGGSQHIHRGHYVSTGVQGESLPVACGIAMAQKGRGHRGLALAYIGDGTWGEGAVYEGLNMAALWHLPVVVVVENNQIAQTTPLALNMAGTIRGRAEAFGIPFVRIEGHDVHRIRTQLGPYFMAVRETPGPLIIEFDTVRIGPHSKGDDTRDAGELERNRSRDWHISYRVAHAAQFASVEQRVAAELAEIFARAERSSFSDWEPA